MPDDKQASNAFKPVASIRQPAGDNVELVAKITSTTMGTRTVFSFTIEKHYVNSRGQAGETKWFNPRHVDPLFKLLHAVDQRLREEELRQRVG